MALIKVKELAYGRLRAPDLDVMEEFLTHFGMVPGGADADRALHARHRSPHHLHVTEKGDPNSSGFAYYAASEDDLQRVARAPGASAVEKIDEPGGGQRVRLREPNGYQIEVVHGIETPPPLPVTRDPMNTGSEPLRRAGVLMRPREGAGADQADRARGDGLAEGSGDGRSGSARRWGSSARTTCTRVKGQHHRLVQPLRLRGRVRRSPHVLLRQQRAGRAEPLSRSRSPTSMRCSWTTSI